MPRAPSPIEEDEREGSTPAANGRRQRTRRSSDGDIGAAQAMAGGRDEREEEEEHEPDVSQVWASHYHDESIEESTMSIVGT